LSVIHVVDFLVWENSCIRLKGSDTS